MDDGEYEKMRRAAYFQYFRVAAILGALLGSILPALFGLIFSIAIDGLLEVPLTMNVAGADVSVLFLAKAAFTVEILREAVILVYRGEPEVRKIDL